MKFFLTRHVGNLDTFQPIEEPPIENVKPVNDLVERIDSLFDIKGKICPENKQWLSIYSERLSKCTQRRSLDVSMASSASYRISARSNQISAPINTTQHKPETLKQLESRWRPVINKSQLPPPPPVPLRRPVSPMHFSVRSRPTMKPPLDCGLSMTR
jgi:hypothetical protein